VATPLSLARNHRTSALQVLVRDNNVDQARKDLKKKMQREGLFREMKLHNYYEKPSERRAREKAEAVRRARKLARKQAQREGLVPPGTHAAPRGAAGAPGRGRSAGAPEGNRRSP
jgi:small subunit ribosomal protein S21